MLSAGVSTAGNTSGNTGMVSNRLVLQGGNGMRISQATDANGATAVFSQLPIGFGVSTGGNTLGDTGTKGSQIVFAGGNNITLSQSTNGQSVTVTISGGGGAGDGYNILAAGTQTANTTGTVSFANSNGLTFGMSNSSVITASHNGLTTAALSDHSHGNPTLNLTNISGTTASASNGLTLSLSAAAPGGGAVLSRFDAPIGQLSSSANVNASASVKYLSIPTGISFSRVDVPILLSLASSATANTGNILISSGLFISTRNGVSLNPVTGSMGTTTYTWASNTSNFANLSGARNASFAINTSLSAGEYWIGFQLSTNNNSSIGTATTQYANTLSVFYNTLHTASAYNDLGQATNTSVGWVNQGMHTNTFTATNQTASLANISKSGTAFVRGNILPIFRNY
jgi:hypothetical protein